MSKEKNQPEEKKTPQTEAEPEAETAAEAAEAPAEKSEADTLRAQLAEQNDKYLRILAEYDNFRRRSRLERENIYADVRADTVVKFLPVYDTLDRALATPTADEAYRKGVEMTMVQFNQTIEKLGITEIEALGQKFDPNVHNAVMHVEDESFGENEVVEVFQKGFKLNDKVIRFAMVKVAN